VYNSLRLCNRHAGGTPIARLLPHRLGAHVSKACPVERVRTRTRNILTAWGSSERPAVITAELMTETDLRGVDSHGISMPPSYQKRRSLKQVDADHGADRRRCEHRPPGRAPRHEQNDLDVVIDVLHQTRRSDPKQPVLVAGEPENAPRNARLREDSPLPEDLIALLRGIAARAGTPFLLD
jgi:LDH2 family malate/lactate/ureidoglycolate dehydrogenase